MHLSLNAMLSARSLSRVPASLRTLMRKFPRPSVSVQRCSLFVGLLILLLSFGAVVSGDVTGDDSPVLMDHRLLPLKDLDGYFPMEVPASLDAWEQRRQDVKQQTQVALGLYPWPSKSRLNAVIHGASDRGDYTIEKVYFEAMPNFYVTGNLYRPKGFGGPRPGILCPHGHWSNGRFYDAGEEATKREIDTGAELFPDSGRSPLQARCVHLARMGCVVFHYDMIGYADSQQITSAIAHGFAKQRTEMNTAERWGLFSPRAESHLQSVMGLQTWSSIRAVDFLLSLPDVDAMRIGVTGASGGGTQSMILAALDDRIAVSFPAVMVSTSMQGGCTCENACLLRVGTGNVEFSALFAPKPQGMTAANDWTKEMATKGFPEIKAVYELYGKGDAVMLSDHTEFGHNYNAVSRKAMYEVVNNAFNLNADLHERDFQRSAIEEMSVWDEDHSKPDSGPDFERTLLAWWHQDSQNQLKELAPSDSESLTKYRSVLRGAMYHLVGAIHSVNRSTENDLQFEQSSIHDLADCERQVGYIMKRSRNEAVPVVIYVPKQSSNQVVIWTSATGKSAIGGDEPISEVADLLKKGFAVISPDLFWQGEFLDGREVEPLTRKVRENRESASYTFGYNRSVFAERARDLISVIAFASQQQFGSNGVHLIAVDSTGPIAAVARSLSSEHCKSAVIRTNGFRFINVDSYRSFDFLPGGAKYVDLDGFLAVAAPSKLLIIGDRSDNLSLTDQAYSAAMEKDSLAIEDEIAWNDILRWLRNLGALDRGIGTAIEPQ